MAIIAVPTPWVVEDDEDGNTIELSAPHDLVFLKVRVNRYASGLSLAVRLPGAVGITSYERTRTTWDGHPALRFERSYLATSSGPLLRVEGLITAGESYIYTVQCDVQVVPFDDPHTTPIEDDQPYQVTWTPVIEQATTRIVGSFTFGSNV